MSRQTRSLSELPEYYFKLTTKQQRNWRKNTKKIQYNESLREQYAPYRPSSNIIRTHLHHQTSVETVEKLIKQAKETKIFIVDTEGQIGELINSGALIQIQFVDSINDSTIILIETNFLPAPQTTLFNKIKELCSIIFNNNNDIVSWGCVEKEFKEFHHLNLINIGNIIKYNLQFLFSNPNGKPITHPAREKREEATGCSFVCDTPGDDEFDDEFDYDDNEQPDKSNSVEPTSLQDAVVRTFNRFLDKSLTVNYWKCGIDLNLNTWRNKLFSRSRYDANIERQERNKRLQYAINDCTSVAELFFHMYPEKMNNYLITPEPEKPTSSNIIKKINNDLSDVSDDELPQIRTPRSNNNKQRTTHELIITTTQQEMNEIMSTTQPEQKQLQETTSTRKLTKQERQKIKNDKFRLKKKYKPSFQNYIRRPIYYKYDYKKIRSQLMDDNITTSHQIKINDNNDEVSIGFKSNELKERAKLRVKINYFSREQYIERWSGKN
ncbi:unnamed protein product [Adineta steineri]|uniref:Uncharacterized protein n=1 Tax=Adineta steineri TaxID=433720 RepID=A0A815RSM1_9BILA|nr:unnamed protein product [Adineta steineri]